MPSMPIERSGDYFDADGNADQVRLWDEDGTLIAQLSNDYDREDHPYVTYTVSASETFRSEWLEECSGHRSWKDALRALFTHELPVAREELAGLLS